MPIDINDTIDNDIELWRGNTIFCYVIKANADVWAYANQCLQINAIWNEKLEGNFTLFIYCKCIKYGSFVKNKTNYPSWKEMWGTVICLEDDGVSTDDEEGGGCCHQEQTKNISNKVERKCEALL